MQDYMVNFRLPLSENRFLTLLNDAAIATGSDVQSRYVKISRDGINVPSAKRHPRLPFSCFFSKGSRNNVTQARVSSCLIPDSDGNYFVYGVDIFREDQGKKESERYVHIIKTALTIYSADP